MTVAHDGGRVTNRPEQLERETPRHMRRLAEAKGIAGPEHDEQTSSLERDIAADVNPEVRHA